MVLVAALRGVTLDCPEPELLAEFYRRLAGGEVVYRSRDLVYLAAWPVGLACQRSEGNGPARWPDHTRRVHLDFHVADADRLDEVEAQVVALGASRPPAQPRPQSWRVLLDPAGHPFCLTATTFTQAGRREAGSKSADPGPLARFAQRHRTERLRS